MTKSTLHIALVASILSLAAFAAVAQDAGAGNTGWQCTYGPRGMGGYGWQSRLSAVADPALAAEITEVHQLIREKQWNLRALRAQGEDVTALQAEVDSLRSRLKSLNERAGLCTGTGPHAFGMNGQPGMGNGAGWDGRGWGARQGYCTGLGNGYGRGAGLGIGNGYGGRGAGLGMGYGYGRGGGFGMGYGPRF